MGGSGKGLSGEVFWRRFRAPVVLPLLRAEVREVVRVLQEGEDRLRFDSHVDPCRGGRTDRAGERAPVKAWIDVGASVFGRWGV